MADYSQGIDNFNRAIELSPTRANWIAYRGWVYYEKTNQYQEAVQDFSKAIELDESYGYAYYMQGVAYQKLGDTEKATLDIKKSQELGYDP